MTKKRIKILFLILLAIFITVRLLGIHVVYHQDELRIAIDIDRPHEWFSIGGYGHGPLMGFIYSVSGVLFGSANMRIFPLFFSVLNFIFLFYLVKYLFGLSQALWALTLFTAAYYSVLGSLMIDVDGAVLPFFFLLSLTAFFKWRPLSGEIFKFRWLIILFLSLAAGFLTKFSFILVITTLGIEFFCQTWSRSNKRLIAKYSFGGILFLVLVAVALMNADLVIPNYPLSDAITHAKGYIKFSDRNYFQTLVQFVKSLFYTSPLLVAPLFFLGREEVRKLRVFVMFLLSGLLFYLVLFDFSLGALDKYLTFIVVPLSVLGGVSLAGIFDGKVGYKQLLAPITIGSVAASLFFLVQFLPHAVPPLWPKTEWVDRVLSFRWNFLMPFTGGSGPAGFYVSWLYIAVNWIFVLILTILALINKNRRWLLAVVIVVLGIGYNIVFTEEYLFGKINGNVTKLVRRSADFIKDDLNIKKVVTYNNIGGYELMKLNKYERRLYVAPKFEPFNREKMGQFKGYYMVIDIPRLDSDSIYAQYFKSCDVVYEDFSQKITAKIYDCPNTLRP